MKLGTDGQYSHPGGGLGGGHRGSGDYSHGGIFVHEQGHAFGIPHTAGWYGEGKFPYPNGGLAGSAWAYDVTRHVMIDVYHHGSLASDHWCKAADSSIPVADNGLCYKQDPMQSGSGMEAGQVYQIYADFNAAHIQRYFEFPAIFSRCQGLKMRPATWGWMRALPVSPCSPLIRCSSLRCSSLRCSSLCCASLPLLHRALLRQSLLLKSRLLAPLLLKSLLLRSHLLKSLLESLFFQFSLFEYLRKSCELLVIFENA